MSAGRTDRNVYVPTARKSEVAILKLAQRDPSTALGMTDESNRFESELEIVDQIAHAFDADT